MIKIDIDKDKKLICIEVAGHIHLEELVEYTKNAGHVISQFGKNEAYILAKLERLDPLAQNSIPLCVEGLSKMAVFIKKIAFIQKRVVTRMQVDRIIKEVNSIHGQIINARSCSTREEAIKFLYE